MFNFSPSRRRSGHGSIKIVPTMVGTIFIESDAEGEDKILAGDFEPCVKIEAFVKIA